MEDEVHFLRELAYQMQSMIDAKAHKARGAVSAGDEAESATG
jgi:hypothetical protein